MPILDSIQAAETKAEKMRSDAHQAASELLEETKFQAEAEAKRILEDAHQKVNQETKATENKIVEITAEIKKQNDLDNLELEEKARKRSEEAINFIIKQVFEI